MTSSFNALIEVSAAWVVKKFVPERPRDLHSPQPVRQRVGSDIAHPVRRTLSQAALRAGHEPGHAPLSRRQTVRHDDGTGRPDCRLTPARARSDRHGRFSRSRSIDHNHVSASPGSAGILPAAGRRPAVVQAGKMPGAPRKSRKTWLIDCGDDGRSRSPAAERPAGASSPPTAPARRDPRPPHRTAPGIPS